jgi:hypothetical protein
MKNQTVVVLGILVLLSTVIFLGCIEYSELSITTIETEKLEPVSSKYFGLVNIYEIDHGESVKLSVTVQNTGKETVHRDDYRVGMKVTSPAEGANYWELPTEEVINIDLSPKGEVTHTFMVINKKELPVSGEFEFQAYIKSEESGEEIVTGDRLVLKITSSHTNAQSNASSRYEKIEKGVLKIYSKLKDAIQELRITRFEAAGLEPVSTQYFGLVNIYEIDHGKSVALSVTVRNTGNEAVHRNDYRIGMKVTSPDAGVGYWELPAEQLIDIDLSPKGEVTHTFVVTNKKELPVSGEFEFQAYIKPVDSDDEIAHSGRLIVKIASP